ncbi:MAG TPA: glycosyltransferase family 2 protein [Flavisolibacter sp.]|nr:glycosyltransferase family 2 protein [Flavisolibacter sp.]
MSTPLVSVLLTAWNREKYIGEAIEHVLAQTFSDFELIITDNASTDGTVDIIKKYAAKDSRIRYYVNEANLGDYPNRNRAASYARGKYIKYTDSDDIFYEHALQVMVSAIEKFPEAGFCMCTQQDPEKPYPVMVSSRQAYLENFYGFNHFGCAPGSVIIKRKAFEAVGGFSGRRLIGDNELWFKLAAHYSMVKIPGGLYWDRNHGDQERFTTFANKNYRKLRHMVMLEAFASQHCPLTEEEKKIILKRVARNERKKKVLKTVYELKNLFAGGQKKYDKLW